MNTIISENDGFSKILGRLSTLALIGLVVLALVAFPHSIKVKAKSGWIGPSLEGPRLSQQTWRIDKLAWAQARPVI